MTIQTGFTHEVDTNEKRAAQFEQDLIVHNWHEGGCNCGACTRVSSYIEEREQERKDQRVEADEILDWLGDWQDGWSDTYEDLRGSMAQF